jgi:hypothetical protein
VNVIKMENFEKSAYLETWMTDDKIWVTDFSSAFIVQEEETVLEIESWMTRENFLDFNYPVVTETETGLELESWMTSEGIWN